ncbi:hypothetical protein SMICM304S_01098 [Streptomyces microflavus]
MTEWHPGKDEWRWYGIYFLLTIAGRGLAHLLVTAAVGWLSPHGQIQRRRAEVTGGLLAGSLGWLLVKRLGHRSAVLWRLRGVQRVTQKVNVANSGVNHVLGIVLAQSLVQLTLALAGFAGSAVLVAGLFVVARLLRSRQHGGPHRQLHPSAGRTRTAPASTTAPTCPKPATTAPTCRAGTTSSAASPGAPAANQQPSASTTRRPSRHGRDPRRPSAPLAATAGARTGDGGPRRTPPQPSPATPRPLGSSPWPKRPARPQTRSSEGGDHRHGLPTTRRRLGPPDLLAEPDGGRGPHPRTPPERYEVTTLGSRFRDKPGRLVGGRGGYIDGFDEFDPAFFGISPRGRPHGPPAAETAGSGPGR